jgi:hypothetical protein
LAKRSLTIIRRAGDQVSTSPIGVFDQSIDRMRAPISLPPARQSQPAADMNVAGVFISHSFRSVLSSTISRRLAEREAIMRKLKTVAD